MAGQPSLKTWSRFAAGLLGSALIGVALSATPATADFAGVSAARLGTAKLKYLPASLPPDVAAPVIATRKAPLVLDDVPRKPRRLTAELEAESGWLLVHQPGSVRALDRLLASLDYATPRGHRSVPPVAISAVPSDLGGHPDTAERKSLFIRTVLPLVLKVNQEILRERQKLLRIERRLGERLADSLPASERRWLQNLAETYRAEPGDLEALKRRVDAVPVGLAMAQAIEESGWGSSRFTRLGNAHFGQRVWSKTADGLVPTGVEDPDFKVRSFASLAGSVRAYALNLNRHPSYAALREARAAARAADRPLDAASLATTLADYSERGQDYVTRLQTLIAQNDLQAFEAAKLRPVEAVATLATAADLLGAQRNALLAR